MEPESKSHLTLGEFLQQAREKKKWTVEHIAEQLKLKISTVKALEANAYQEIGGMVYVKGYLRSYAKLLYVNVDKALEQLTEAHESHSSEGYSVKKTVEKRMRIPQVEHAGVWVSIIILAILLMIVFAWHRHETYEKLMKTRANLSGNTSNTSHGVELPKISVTFVSTKASPKPETGSAFPLLNDPNNMNNE